MPPLKGVKFFYKSSLFKFSVTYPTAGGREGGREDKKGGKRERKGSSLMHGQRRDVDVQSGHDPRPIEEEGRAEGDQRNYDLHNFWPELRVPLISVRLAMRGGEWALIEILSCLLLAPLAKFCSPLSLSLSLIAPLEALHSVRRRRPRPSFCGR